MGQHPLKNRVRIIGLILIGLPAIGIALQSPETRDYSGQVQAALSLAGLNEEAASGVPQQQVVNGWVARDRLEIIATQGSEAAINQRVPVLLLVVVLAAVWNALLWPTTQVAPPPASTYPRSTA